jgi:hypothetical protein
MNDFTKEELKDLLFCVEDHKGYQNDSIHNNLENKIQSVGTGQLLFHNKDAAIALIAKINKHIHLCENDDESKCFRIDWQIIYGPKTK